MTNAEDIPQANNDPDTDDGPTFADRLVRLKDAFPPDRVRWRLMSRPRDPNNPRGQAVAYVGMTDVEDFLDEVMGSNNWRASYPVVGQFVICRIELRDDDHSWIGKEDGAGDNVDREAQNVKEDDLDKDTKAVLSDAFKRAARRWGIGRYLATLEKPWVNCKPIGNSWAIDDHEWARLAQLAGGQAVPQQQRAPQQYQPPAQNYAPPAQQQQHHDNAGPPPAQRGGYAPPAQQHQQQYNGPPSPRQQQQARPQQGKVYTIPAGRAKDTPLHEATEADILFWRDRKATENNPRFARSNQEWVAAADAELARRQGGGAPAQAPAQAPASASRQERPPPAPRGGNAQRQDGGYQGPPPADFGYPPPQDPHQAYSPNGDDIPF